MSSFEELTPIVPDSRMAIGIISTTIGVLFMKADAAMTQAASRAIVVSGRCVAPAVMRSGNSR